MHLLSADIMDAFATQFCNIVQPGIKYLLKNGNHALSGQETRDKQGVTWEGTPSGAMICQHKQQQSGY